TEHALDAPDVGRGDVGGAVQTTLTPRGLVLEQVATVGLLAADLAAAGDLEALTRSRMALRLRCHGVLSPYIGWLPPRGARAPRGWRVVHRPTRKRSVLRLGDGVGSLLPTPSPTLLSAAAPALAGAVRC